MTSTVVSDRIDRLIRAMDEQGWDCVLATSPESVLYLSGAVIHTQTLMRRRQCAVLVMRDGRTTLVVPEIEKGLATRMSGLQNIATYKVLSESACLTSVGVLQRQGHGPAVVGLEKTHLPVVDFEYLVAHLPVTRFVSADEALATLRMLKSDDEVQTMGRAAAAMDEAIRTALGDANVGTREDEVAARIGQHVQHLAGGKVRSVTGLVAAGENLRIPHHMANATGLRVGDLMRVGCRTVFEGYHGIVVRTGMVGECPPSTLDHYSRLHQGHRQLLASLLPGVTAGWVYEQAASTSRALGLNPTNPHFGYATGLEFQEKPKLAPGATECLQAGMTMLVESVSHDPGAGHLYIVDMVVLEADGARVLSNVSDTAKPLLVTPS